MTTNNPTIVGTVGGGAAYTAPIITGGTINNTPIGGTTPAAVSGTTGTYTGNVTVGKTNGGNIVVCDNHVGPNDCDAVPLEFPTFTTLRAFQPNVIGNMLTAHTAGFAAAGDGGGALYDWVAASTCTNDSTYCVIPTGTWPTGRWLMRVPTGGVDVRANGAKCDGVTDDTAVINSLILRTSATLGGGTVVIPALGSAAGPSGCLINTANLLMKSGVTLRGAVSPFVGTQGFTQAYNSMLLLNPSFTITMAAGSALQDLVVWRSGLALQPANNEAAVAAVATWQADTSIGVTLASSSEVRRVRVIGFHTSLKQTGGGDAVLDDVQFDGANGIELSATNAPTYMDKIQANEWWTSGFGGRLSAVAASVTAGGSAYTNSGTVTASGGTCTTHPTFTSTASGGVVSALTPLDGGDCTVAPSGSTFTGGGGTGLTATINYQSGGYRPGIAYYDHDGVGSRLTHFLFEGYQTGIKIDNSSGISVAFGTIEGMSPSMLWAQVTGILTQNCAESKYYDVVNTAHYNNLVFNAKSDQSAATCDVPGGNNNVIGVSEYIGGQLNTVAAALNADIVVGAGATAIINGTRLSSSGAVSNVTVGAGASASLANLAMNVVSMHNPWITADATAIVSTCGGMGDGTAALSTIAYLDTCAKAGAGINTLIGSGAAIATNSTTGFLMLPTMAGAPSGTVGAAGQAAVVIDTTSKKICYSTGSGTWECSAAFTP